MKNERKNLKGAVLFTVVSVLAILIIFMTCTLAMAAAANKRARKTYSTSQSSYTARTVIDSVLASVAKDTTFSSAIHNLSEGNSIDLVVEINNPSMGSIDNVKVTNIGKKTFYDPEAKDWADRNILEITADITIGSETTTIKSSIIQDPPQPPGDGGGGAAFLTYGSGLDMGNFVSSWGGTYYGMGEWTKDGDPIAGRWNHQLQYNEYNSAGDENGYGELITLANKAYLTHKDYHYKDVNAVEAPFVVNGNFKVSTQLNVYLTHFAAGINNPGIQIWGDLEFTNDEFSIRAADHLYRNLDKITDFTSIPYLYVDGKLKVGTKGFLGVMSKDDAALTVKKDIPFNVFCGSMGKAVDNPEGFDIAGDLYMMDAGEDSLVARTNGGQLLYAWASSVINKTSGYSSQGGNLYSKGNVIFEGNLVIKGDVRVEGDVILTGDVKIDGDLVVGGNIDVGPHNLTVNGDVYRGPVAGSLKEGYEEKTETVIPISGFTVNHINWTETRNNIFIFESKIEELGKLVPSISGKITVEDGSATYSGDPIPEKEWNKISPKLTNNASRKRIYYVNTDGVEVPVSEACEMVSAEGMAIAGKTVKDVQDYIDDNGPVYPARAERETLMGVTWPVKGIEHRVVEAPEGIDFDEKLPNGADRYRIFNGQNELGDNIIRTTCTLTGEFTKTVTVKPDADSTIYIRLKTVNFESPVRPDADGIERVTNEAKIVVDESNGGKVYFVLAGLNVSSNYAAKYDDEVSSKKLLKTVYDWMDLFALDNEEQRDQEKPDPEPTESQTLDGGDQGRVKSTKTAPYAADGKDIKLTGTWQETIYIKGPAKGNVLWVVLDKFKLESSGKIIVLDNEDGGIVKFYVENNVEFSSGTMLVEQSFLDLADSEGDIYMFSDSNYMNQMIDGKINEDRIYKGPKILIHAAKAVNGVYPQFKAESGVLLTAYVRAIDMETIYKKGLDYNSVADKIIYNGHRLKYTRPENKEIGVIGMLDVRSIDGENEWLMLYVDESAGKTPVILDANGLHTYAAVEYYAYVN